LDRWFRPTASYYVIDRTCPRDALRFAGNAPTSLVALSPVANTKTPTVTPARRCPVNHAILRGE